MGNLRTAMAAAVVARATGRGFVIRMEDLDRVTASVEHEQRQLDDLATVGVCSGVPVVRQSDRFDRYHAAIEQLRSAGLVYECFCSRREIQAAVTAPHGLAPGGAYPGTCRSLSDDDRRSRLEAGRRPALRLRTDGEPVVVHDRFAGRVVGNVDDVVLARADGVPAYNLAVVVDDAAQGVTQVVRGDDLLSSTPRQIHLQRLLGLPTPEYAHVPLVVGPTGERLAKRDGAVTLRDLGDRGVSPTIVRDALAASLGLGPGDGDDPVAKWAIEWRDEMLPRAAWPIERFGLPT